MTTTTFVVNLVLNTKHFCSRRITPICELTDAISRRNLLKSASVVTAASLLNAKPVCACRKCSRRFADIMENEMVEYEARIAKRKAQLFSRLRPNTTILDIGTGAGPNLAFIPRGAHVIGLEPNRYMWPYAQEKVTGHFNLSLIDGVAEQVPLETASVDTVICTLTLCTVDSPVTAMKEITRVLRSGGEFLFIEHVLASKSDPIRRTAQLLLNPLQRIAADGCNINRDTGATFRESAKTGAFEIKKLENFNAEFGTPLDNLTLVRPHISGVMQRTSLQFDSFGSS